MEMNNGENEIIKTGEYTVKELIKMLWKSVDEISEKLDKYEEKHSDRLMKFERRLDKLEDFRLEHESKNTGKLDLVKWAGWIIAALVGLFQLIKIIAPFLI